MKHYRARFKGEKTLDEVQAAVGRAGGLVSRVHVEGGETQVYFTAGEKSGRPGGLPGAGDPEEVREEEVFRIA
ncbi:MAG TPA: hypothetical protein VF142_00455 [Longimicrobium sp.]